MLKHSHGLLPVSLLCCDKLVSRNFEPKKSETPTDGLFLCRTRPTVSLCGHDNIRPAQHSKRFEDFLLLYLHQDVPIKDSGIVHADPHQCRKRLARTMGCYGLRGLCCPPLHNDSTYFIPFAVVPMDAILFLGTLDLRLSNFTHIPRHSDIPKSRRFDNGPLVVVQSITILVVRRLKVQGCCI